MKNYRWQKNTSEALVKHVMRYLEFALHSIKNGENFSLATAPRGIFLLGVLSRNIFDLNKIFNFFETLLNLNF
jgi:hypothetical protein